MVITKQLLDDVYQNNFNFEKFINVDPCGTVYKLIEHTDRQLDIEIGALFVAMIAWGSRKVICPTALNMLENEMKWHPADFILNGDFEHSYKNAKNNCVYRTLNVDTFKKVCRNVRNAIEGYNTMEEMIEGMPTKDAIGKICEMLSDARVGTMDKSACKRVCMFVRWMTRDGQPDFNIWKSRDKADLYAVMDVHVCQLTSSILPFKQPSWKACEYLTSMFKEWDPIDPLKYDVALMTLADMPDSEQV